MVGEVQSYHPAALERFAASMRGVQRQGFFRCFWIAIMLCYCCCVEGGRNGCKLVLRKMDVR
jgi:hypothetical protein